MRVSSTMHDDNWHSENPQPYLVEKGSNFTLTCTAKRPRGSSLQLEDIIWFVNERIQKRAYCKNGKQSPVETCSLTLRWPDVGGKYTCQAANSKNVCTSKVLELKVAGKSRLIQVSNYYYYYYYRFTTVARKYHEKACKRSFMRKKKVVMISVGHGRKKIQVKLVKIGPLIDNIIVIIIIIIIMIMMMMMMITIITIVILLLL